VCSSDLEYISRKNGTYAIAAVTKSGERRVVQEGPGPLKSEAGQYAILMDKQLAIVDETTGFHKANP
jgi:hypothetical protein